MTLSPLFVSLALAGAALLGARQLLRWGLAATATVAGTQPADLGLHAAGYAVLLPEVGVGVEFGDLGTCGASDRANGRGRNVWSGRVRIVPDRPPALTSDHAAGWLTPLNV